MPLDFKHLPDSASNGELDFNSLPDAATTQSGELNFSSLPDAAPKAGVWDYLS